MTSNAKLANDDIKVLCHRAGCNYQFPGSLMVGHVRSNELGNLELTLSQGLNQRLTGAIRLDGQP